MERLGFILHKSCVSHAGVIEVWTEVRPFFMKKMRRRMEIDQVMYGGARQLAI